jgi:iron(III) transport system ATP-binding protein
MLKPLVITELSHRFDNKDVFSSVSLQVNEGELIAVLGASGCGKTTLLRAIAGLICPRSGSIQIQGQEVTSDGQMLVPIEQRRIGLVFQDYALFPYLSVYENVAFGLKQPDPSRVNALLERTGILELAQRRPAALSGGQQQRVALARALAPRPHLLLLDEPFANIDAFRRRQLGQSLVQTLRHEGRAGLFVTHDQSDAMSHASRIAVFTDEEGTSTIRQCDTPEKVFRNPSSRAVAELLGPASFIRAQAEGKEAKSVFGTHPLLLEADGTVDLMYRTDELSFVPDPNGLASVSGVNYLGTHFRLTCETPTGTVISDIAQNPPPLHTQGRVVPLRAAWAMPKS